MYRLTPLMMIPIILSTSAALHASGAWPNTYTFFGRWDLRDAKCAVTVNSGSYILARFSGTGISATFDLSVNQPPPPTLAWRIDEGEWHEAEIAPNVKLADGLSHGRHTVMLMVRSLDEHQSRWNQPLVASVTFTGFSMEAGGKLEHSLPEWRKPALSIEFLGDSITEGVLVQEGRAGVVEGMPRTWPWLSDARMSYAGQTAMMLKAAWRQVGFGATGLVRVGSGGAAGALEAFNSFYKGCPRDSWQPDVVVVNQGTNEGSMPPAEYQRLYARYLAMIRAAYPKAKIVALRPFCGAQEAAIRAAVDACGDPSVYYIDTAGWYSGPIHPNAADSTKLAEKLAHALRTDVLASR